MFNSQNLIPMKEGNNRSPSNKLGRPAARGCGSEPRRKAPPPHCQSRRLAPWHPCGHPKSQDDHPHIRKTSAVVYPGSEGEGVGTVSMGALLWQRGLTGGGGERREKAGSQKQAASPKSEGSENFTPSHYRPSHYIRSASPRLILPAPWTKEVKRFAERLFVVQTSPTSQSCSH